jgi:hypothetical protein
VSRALVADHSKARPPNPGRDLGCRMRSTAAFVRANKCRPAHRLPSSIDRPRTPCGREWRQENLNRRRVEVRGHRFYSPRLAPVVRIPLA